MPLTSGDRLEHYEISAPIGAGGMGEVYRATDTKLKREVAIKVLPPHFAADSGRLLRFQREAQMLAALNHPNIAAIYGLEHTRGVHFLVMELVEGETIAERLASRHMEVSEALRFAVQIADAMQAAHDRGVIHRDLKPANVKITPEGRIKVLDFGLAKALGEADHPVSADPSNSPTMTAIDTHAGVVLGTAPYMSPEQASGQAVDKRADIWSFGVLLYEMLSGKRAFTGKTTSHILVKVLEYEPDWNALPPLPAGVQDLLERCLQKVTENRLRDIGDIRVLLQSSITKPVAIQQRRDVRAPTRWLWPGIAGLLVVLLLIGYVYRRPAAPPAEPISFEISNPQNSALWAYVRVSPDGSKVAFIAGTATAAPQIWVRPLQSLDAKALDGTQQVQGIPFWTHDSRYLVFTSNGAMRKVDVSGGPAQLVADEVLALGGFSTPDGQIIYATPVGGIARIAAVGGGPAPTGNSPMLQAGLYPSPLPDGNHFLFLVPTGPDAKAVPGIYVGSLDGSEPRKILSDVSRAVYAPSTDPKAGYLLFLRGTNNVGTLMAQPVDASTITPVGEAIPIAESVSFQGFSASNTGVLVHGTGGSAVPIGVPGMVQGRMHWLDRNGKNVGTFAESSVHRIPAISPDGKYVAMETYSSNNAYLEIFEIGTGLSTRFTFEPGSAFDPVWSPNGDRLAYATQLRGFSWNAKNADRSGQEELLFRPTRTMTPHSWSPDGKFLLGNDAFFPADVFAVDLSSAPASERKPIPVVNARQANELHARFSPDGNWFAYVSDESGKQEIYVRPWDAKAGRPGDGGLTIVSTGGARAGGAVWRRSEPKELYYLSPDGAMMAVEVNAGATFTVKESRALFKIDAPNVYFFDVTPDGQRFVMPLPEKPVAMMAPFKVILNWTSTLKN